MKFEELIQSTKDILVEKEWEEFSIDVPVTFIPPYAASLYVYREGHQVGMEREGLDLDDVFDLLYSDLCDWAAGVNGNWDEYMYDPNATYTTACREPRR